jgi:DNA topoisomerase-2
MSLDKYKKLTQREHVLLRKNMYCGDSTTQEVEMYVVDNINELNDIKLKKKKVKYNPAFLKIFDEAISNASDASIRYGNVTYIKTWVDKATNTITIENDCIGGGIPIELHPTEKCYVPEMLFSSFLTGENYNDGDKRVLSGQNGLGIKLLSVLSNKCVIDLADGKKSYKQEFTDNLLNIGKPKIKDSNKFYVRLSYQPDFNQFDGIDNIDDDIISLIIKRIVDLSVYSQNVKFYFNDKHVKVKSFKDWMKLHLDDTTQMYIDDSNDKWIYGVAKSPTEMFEQVSICSSVSTYRAGTHVNYISLNLSKAVADSFSKKIKANWVDVKNKMMLFVIAKIPNPTFDSQTKECLTNLINKEVLNNFSISDNFVKKIMKSEIVESILRALELKEKDELKRLQKSQQKMKVEKLVDANSKDRSKCQIFIYEGDSAASNSRLYRDPQNQGFYLLKGKFANVSKMTQKEILNTKEVVGLMNSIGLELNTKLNFEELRYNEILICCDMDFDGDSITGLLINFFASQWKELFERGMVYRVMTPLNIISKGKDIKYFYTNEDWIEYQNKNSIKGWEVTFCKGLGSLNGEAYKDMMENPRKIRLNWDDTSKEMLNAWFGDDVNLRKNMLQ